MPPHPVPLHPSPLPASRAQRDDALATGAYGTQEANAPSVSKSRHIPRAVDGGGIRVQAADGGHI
eukprot:352932-Chlamydomonas_euryale.AAC.7